jgi:hypothetical protein
MATRTSHPWEAIFPRPGTVHLTPLLLKVCQGNLWFLIDYFTLFGTMCAIFTKLNITNFSLA